MTVADTISKRPNRWLLAIFLFVLTTINFADRGVLGVVAPILTKVFNLSVFQFGIVASGFGWGYTLFVFLSGPIVAKLGARRTLLYFVSAWSVFIASIAFSWGFLSLFVLRVCFGAAEGAVFPASSQLIGRQYTHQETGRATAVMTVGLPLGSFIIVPVAVWLTRTSYWWTSFILLGVVGILWVIFARYIITRPVTTTDEKLLAPTPWKRILTSKTLLLTGLGFFSSAYVLYFMLNFFPSYLVHERHVPYADIALLGTVPWLAMAFGALVSGFISDFLYKKTGSLRISRSYFSGAALIITGFFIFISTQIDNTDLIVALLSIGCFTNFLANSVFFAITVDTTPEYAGPASALTNGLGSISGIVAPLFTGYLVQTSGAYSSAFILAMAIVVSAGVLIAIFCDPRKL